MQITFDTTNPNDLKILTHLLQFSVEEKAQPQVATNSGTTGSGSSLSDEASGVSESAAPAAAPAPVKEKKAKKSAVAEQPKSEPASTEDAPTQEAAPEVRSGQEWAKAATLDDVRAALQTFTAANGVPAGIELLKKYGAARVSELAEANYAAFLADCK